MYIYIQREREREREREKEKERERERNKHVGCKNNEMKKVHLNVINSKARNMLCTYVDISRGKGVPNIPDTHGKQNS